MRFLPTACLFTVLAALSVAAKADTLQIFSLQADMDDGFTAQGALVLDATTGNVTTSNFTISLNGAVQSTFTDSFNTVFDGFYQASFVGSDPNYLYVVLFRQADLTGYEGGSLCSVAMPCDGYASGSYVPGGWEPANTAGLSPVPEPSSLSLLATGALGLLAFARARSGASLNRPTP